MRKRNVFYSLFFFLHLLQQASSDVHSISGYFLGSQGLNLPDYMERITVDDVGMYYYDSTMNAEVPCPEWLNTTEGQEHWKDINLISLDNRHRFASSLQSAILQFNLTGSSSNVNVYQGVGRCSLYPDGTLKAVLTHAFNGEDFLSFDIDTKTFIASVPQAVIYKRQREENPVFLEHLTFFYKKTCFERLKILLQHAPAVNMKKVPEVRLFKRTKAGSKVLTCHVTGFYPRDVQVEWVGAGLQSVEEEMVDVLPNGDGTYQTRRSVIRPEENPEEHKYSCVVHHSSVAGNVTKTWEEHSGLAAWIWISLICFFLAIAGTGLLFRRLCKTKDVGI
ncbi:class I histocompatibility antigen, F10 alpha chain-like [Colossoma macropomum]|uniref:class I histocompatibility antigen, F10 alpha chain-like n=1 Tax=Colossoma macropomum TaxID=42526 RepID=UPI0018653C7C|nr:class I histocompatibility antigen, F10 alpha chain-like [Colossoma macropomum]